MPGSVVARYVVVDGDGRALVLYQQLALTRLIEPIPHMAVVASFEKQDPPTIFTRARALEWIGRMGGRMVDRSEIGR